jgi:hypothetical protein
MTDAINDKGVAIGWSLALRVKSCDGPTHEFVYHGTMHDLGSGILLILGQHFVVCATRLTWPLESLRKRVPGRNRVIECGVGRPVSCKLSLELQDSEWCPRRR